MQSKLSIQTTAQLGQLVRAVRKWQHLRQNEVGRLSHTFVGEMESGKPTAQIGKVFEALHELGIKLHLELPAGMASSSLEEQLRSIAR